MDRKERFDRSYLAMAHAFAGNSRAIRLKVGALLVKDGRVIAEGFNGTVRGMRNACEYIEQDGEIGIFEDADIDKVALGWREGVIRLVSKPDVIHAEMNAMLKCASGGGVGCKGATMYITDSPCLDCACKMVQCGIARVVYDREYRIKDGIEYLRAAGVEVTRISDEED